MKPHLNWDAATQQPVLNTSAQSCVKRHYVWAQIPGGASEVAGARNSTVMQAALDSLRACGAEAYQG